jgi:hypothetical protein
VTWLRSWTSAAATCKVSRWLSVSTAIWTLEPRRRFALSYQPGCHFRVSIGVCGYRKSPPRAQPYAPTPAASRRADLGPWRQTRQRCTSGGFFSTPYTIVASHAASSTTLPPLVQSTAGR